MEGGGEGDDHMRVPLLLSEDGGNINEYGRERCCRNSVASLKCDFFSKLPEKVRSGLDPETPFHLDLSKTTGLIEGTKNSLFLCLWCLVSLFFFFFKPPPPPANYFHLFSPFFLAKLNGSRGSHSNVVILRSLDLFAWWVYHKALGHN